ncbi:hypothetical protein GLOTRDRAFT_22969, partial [Gloeophyllum trabeum ATCC 11539]
PYTTPELRSQIVAWRYEQGLSVHDIHKLCGYSLSTIYEILSIYRTYGQVVDPSNRPRGRPRKLDMSDLDFIHGLLRDNPALYLDEIQEILSEHK